MPCPPFGGWRMERLSRRSGFPRLGPAVCERVSAGNSLAVLGDGPQDFVGGLRPGEGPGVLVPLVDPLADVGLRFGDAAVG
jgi:hypothetical protein